MSFRMNIKKLKVGVIKFILMTLRKLFVSKFVSIDIVGNIEGDKFNENLINNLVS